MEAQILDDLSEHMELERQDGSSLKALAYGLLLKHYTRNPVPAPVERKYQMHKERRLGFEDVFLQVRPRNDHNPLGRFFGYMGRHGPNSGIVEESVCNLQLPHANAGLWFLERVLEMYDRQDREAILKALDLDDAKGSLTRLREMGVARGLSLAEVAGYSYAKLTAFLGGKATFWSGLEAGSLQPYATAVPGPLKEMLSGSVHLEAIDTGKELCSQDNYEMVFSSCYDAFMAVNFGGLHGGDELFEKLGGSLVPNRNSVYITKDEPCEVL